MLLRKLLIISLFGLLFLPENSFGQDQEIRYYEYDNNLKSYVPAVDLEERVSFFTKTEDGSNAYLNICFPEETSIFINNLLVYSGVESNCNNYSLDSLHSQFKTDSVFFTIYSERGLEALKSTIVFPRDVESDSLLLARRENSPEKDFFIIATLLVLFLIGLWRLDLNAQSIGHINVSNLLAVRVRDSSMYNTTFFQIDNLKFFGILSVISGLTVMYFNLHFTKLILMYNPDTVFSLVLSWIVNSGAYFVFLYIKFLLVTFFSEVYNFRSFRYIQYYDFIRFLFLGAIFIFLMVAVDFISGGLFAQSLFIWTLYFSTLILLVYVILTFQKLNKLFSNKKLHLFFYLCATEIIPIILIVKISR